jgi:DNA polymerase-3 subunit delta'
MPIVQLSEIIGQPEAVGFLKGVVEGGRYANAYLLHGPAGVGKGTAALAFARAMLCDTRNPRPLDEPPSLFGESGAGSQQAAPEKAPPGEACNHCPACAKTATLQHPDLKLLFPVSGEERELDETVAETLAAWRADPLFVFTYERAASIRLSLTRELLRELAFRPYEAARRVVVVRDADRMREDQYSALLKSIEEPGASTVWILTTSRPTLLPATIRSRCHRVRFRPLTEKAIEQFLRERADVYERSARMLAALSSGSLGRALVMRDSNPLETRNQSLEMLAPARRGDASGLWLSVNRFGRVGRETLRRMIEFQLLWQRDLLRAFCDAPRELLVHRDSEAEIRHEATHIDPTEIRRRIMILEEALRSIEGNITADLALF